WPSSTQTSRIESRNGDTVTIFLCVNKANTETRTRVGLGGGHANNKSVRRLPRTPIQCPQTLERIKSGVDVPGQKRLGQAGRYGGGRSRRRTSQGASTKPKTAFGSSASGSPLPAHHRGL